MRSVKIANSDVADAWRNFGSVIVKWLDVFVVVQCCNEITHLLRLLKSEVNYELFFQKHSFELKTFNKNGYFSFEKLDMQLFVNNNLIQKIDIWWMLILFYIPLNLQVSWMCILRSF